MTRAVMCDVMRAEWEAVNPGWETVFLEQGLHRTPERLHAELQKAIDVLAGDDAVLLGYGLCSNALLGIRARGRPLAVPLVEDCISLFLGSAAAYMAEFAREPATYYFTKGWIVNDRDPYKEYRRSVGRWGEETAGWIAREMMKNYRRAAYINTGCYDTAEYYAYAGEFAAFFGLRRELVAGSMDFFRALAAGRWEDCLVLPPGAEISEAVFRAAMNARLGLPPP